MQHAQTRAEIASQFDEMKELLAVVTAAADLALAESSDQEAPTDPEHARLAARIDSARELFNDGNITSARKLLEQVRARPATSRMIRSFACSRSLGPALSQPEDLPVGCAFLDQAHHLHPDNPAGLANAAQAARLREDPREAIALSRRSLELKPRDPHAAAVLIESLWDAGETEQLDEFVAAEDWTVDDRQCALTLALIRTDQHRFDDALELSRASSKTARRTMTRASCWLGACSQPRRSATAATSSLGPARRRDEAPERSSFSSPRSYRLGAFRP